MANHPAQQAVVVAAGVSAGVSGEPRTPTVVTRFPRRCTGALFPAAMVEEFVPVGLLSMVEDVAKEAFLVPR